MAQVNLARRAEIGQQKRERTRAAIVAAARALYSAASPAPLTVDAVTGEARIAKGTFYVHFADLAALEAELADGLLTDLDERLQPDRLRLDDPVERLATAFTILATDLAMAPSAARLVARAATTMPRIAPAVRARLLADITAAQTQGSIGIADPRLAADLVSAIALVVAHAAGEGRMAPDDVAGATRAMLRALGLGSRDAEAVANRAAARAAARA